MKEYRDFRRAHTGELARGRSAQHVIIDAARCMFYCLLVLIPLTWFVYAFSWRIAPAIDNIQIRYNDTERDVQYITQLGNIDKAKSLLISSRMTTREPKRWRTENGVEYIYASVSPNGGKSPQLSDCNIVYCVVVTDVVVKMPPSRDVRVHLYLPKKKQSLADNRNLSDSTRWEEVRWYVVGNLAESNVLMSISQSQASLGLMQPTFSTGLGSISAWLDAHLKDEMQRMSDDTVPSDDLSGIVPSKSELSLNGVSTLERAIESHWSRVLDNPLTFTLQLLVGPVQLVILTLTYLSFRLKRARSIALTGVIRYCAKECRTKDMETSRREARTRCRTIHDERAIAASESQLIGGSGGEETPVKWKIDRSILSILDVLRISQMRMENSWQELMRRRATDAIMDITASRRLVVWCIAMLPLLGFFGTIIAISMTIGNTSQIVSDEFGRQQSGLVKLTTHLSLAFHTTLVGIVCYFVAGGSSVAASSEEEDAIRNLTDAVEDLAIGKRRNPPAQQNPVDAVD